MDFIRLPDGSVELNELDIYLFRRVIEENGGEWVGVQQGFEDVEPCVLFNARSGHGSTMALKVTECTAERVRAKLRSKAKEMKGSKHT